MDVSDVSPEKDLRIPILNVLSRTDVMSVDDLVDAVIEEIGSSKDVLEVMVPKGDMSRIKKRVNDVCYDFKRRGLVENPQDGYRRMTDLGHEVLEDGRDPRSMPIIVDENEADDMSDTPSGDGAESFFDYLESKGLVYDTETVEDFLLSLKAKQFVILSGGTGTGKTKLAQAYGEFISSSGPLSEMKFTITLGKQINHGAMGLSRRELEMYCPDAYKANLKCKIRIRDVESNGKLEMNARYFIDKKDEHGKEAIERLITIRNEEGKSEEEICLLSECPDDKKYEIVPVGSNWTDNRHILGYMNAISGKYVRTPSLDLIIASDADPLNHYMLILDEMNLSHVERYFSDIISCMESGEPIRLESDGSVPESLSIGDNLFVVGTVNMDETTYTFSPKVLDRANVLEFAIPPARSYLESTPSYDPCGDVDYLQDPSKGAKCRRMNAKDIIAEMRDGGAKEVTGSIVGDLESIQNRVADIGLPFAFRTMDEIMRFMYVAWRYEGGGEFANWKRYMDAQIRQKVLPKIHGNVSILEGLKGLRDFCETSGYSGSERKLSRMVKILESQRYVSFNC